ncbi:uncharacterized protein LOC110627843 isoform X2 [Manihot esculenta]|nr:uncharacterized protein LOC110627843 isoform X2 [Manihot esculenta]KAG8642749.1 hypothetical protein MANES_12G115700v8 [Manihot esculenta]
MSSNPGHYVALVVTSPTVKTENGLPLKQLKLLRPDDTLLIGQVYRLISFEDVLKEFASKNCVKLGKLLKDRRGLVDAAEMKKKESSGGLSLNPNPNPKPSSITKSETCSSVKVEQEFPRLGSNGASTSSSRGGGVGRHHGGGGGVQWKPALQSISEIGT